MKNLVQSIYEAFDKTIQPKDSDLFLEGWETYDKFDEALTDLAEADWKQIPFPIVTKHREVLDGLTPDWFRYLLPAFMVQTLENIAEADILRETTRYSLTHPILLENFEQKSEKRFQSIVGLLDSQQCYVIGQYLRYFVVLDPDVAVYDDSNIRSAIQFWDQARREKQAIESNQD